MATYDTTIRTVTHTERVTTHHTDWIDFDGYDWWNPKHSSTFCCDADGKRQRIAKQIAYVRVISDALAEDKEVNASDYGGWPRIWHRVIGIGMVSKWPYWEPRPTVLVIGTIGTEAYDWNSITGVRVDADTDRRVAELAEQIVSDADQKGAA